MNPTPEIPALNADATVRDTYQKCLNNCMIIRCIMRTAISKEFSCVTLRIDFDDRKLFEKITNEFLIFEEYFCDISESPKD